MRKFFTGAAFFTGGLPTARVAKREVDARSNEAGAKEAVPARRVDRTTSLILIYQSVSCLRSGWVGFVGLLKKDAPSSLTRGSKS